MPARCFSPPLFPFFSLSFVFLSRCPDFPRVFVRRLTRRHPPCSIACVFLSAYAGAHLTASVRGVSPQVLRHPLYQRRPPPFLSLSTRKTDTQNSQHFNETDRSAVQRRLPCCLRHPSEESCDAACARPCLDDVMPTICLICDARRAFRTRLLPLSFLSHLILTRTALSVTYSGAMRRFDRPLHAAPRAQHRKDSRRPTIRKT